MGGLLLLLYNLTLSNHYRFLVQTIFSARKCHGSALSSAAHFWVLKLLRRPVTTIKYGQPYWNSVPLSCTRLLDTTSLTVQSL